MHKSLIAVIGACALLGNPAQAAKPSFKCAEATHEAEKLICEDNELAALDVKLSSLYGKVAKNTPADQKKQLKAEQIGWVKGRNDCWKAADQRACIKTEYVARIKELKGK